MMKLKNNLMVLRDMVKGIQKQDFWSVSSSPPPQAPAPNLGQRLPGLLRGWMT
ncbi:rCG36928 [Rattus norvegicus]|uniref:RCG36928 n=1 Tax=Rattus norvegicus TaxID=10116 RepID=A6HTP5_RAT|nr:rCG36928 [Rattus norvegicus]